MRTVVASGSRALKPGNPPSNRTISLTPLRCAHISASWPQNHSDTTKLIVERTASPAMSRNTGAFRYWLIYDNTRDRIASVSAFCSSSQPLSSDWVADAMYKAMLGISGDCIIQGSISLSKSFGSDSPSMDVRFGVTKRTTGQQEFSLLARKRMPRGAHGRALMVVQPKTYRIGEVQRSLWSARWGNRSGS